MKQILIILLSIFYFVACANNSSNSGDAAGVSTAAGATATASAVKVKNGSNTVLGYVTQGHEVSLKLLTPTGWFVALNFDGTDAVTTIYFSGASCTGTAYYYSNSVMYGKTLLYDGAAYYKPASVNANNYSTAASQSLLSYRSTMGCTAYSNTLPVITLTSATRTESGLPASITLPIQLETP